MRDSRAWAIIGRYLDGDLDGIKALIEDDPAVLAAMTEIATQALISLYGRDFLRMIITELLLQRTDS